MKFKQNTLTRKNQEVYFQISIYLKTPRKSLLNGVKSIKFSDNLQTI